MMMIHIYIYTWLVGWNMFYFPYLACHPKPIDEVHDFSGLAETTKDKTRPLGLVIDIEAAAGA
jgi:hypothetical protein